MSYAVEKNMASQLTRVSKLEDLAAMAVMFLLTCSQRWENQLIPRSSQILYSGQAILFLMTSGSIQQSTQPPIRKDQLSSSKLISHSMPSIQQREITTLESLTVKTFLFLILCFRSIQISGKITQTRQLKRSMLNKVTTLRSLN